MRSSCWLCCAALLMLCSLGCSQLAGIDDLEAEDRLGRAERAPCSATRECIARLGPHHICRSDQARCVSLLSPECNSVTGRYDSDAALLLGSIEPVSGPNASSGRSKRRGLALAVEDFELSSRGLPPVDAIGERRPIAIVHCDDAGSSAAAVRAARHLTEQVGTRAIIGASFSGVTLTVATQVTIPAGALLMAPSATSVALSDLADGGLVWRTAPSDALQARAQVALVRRVETELRALHGADARLRLALLHKGDAYGHGLADDVSRLLTWNGATLLSDANAGAFLRFDYGDPGAAESHPLNYAPAVAAAIALRPHLVLLYGTSEAASEILRPLHEQWPADVPRPRYLLADGSHRAELPQILAQLAANDPTLLDQILGTEPGSLSPDYASYRALYASKEGSAAEPITFGSANAYDAVYLLAYAAVVAQKVKPSGQEFAGALHKLVPLAGSGRTEVHVGLTSINTALRELSRTGAINLEGASGPLDFDLQTGDVLSDILLWCPQSTAGASTTLVSYGERYDPNTDVIVGNAQLARCGAH